MKIFIGVLTMCFCFFEANFSIANATVPLDAVLLKDGSRIKGNIMNINGKDTVAIKMENGCTCYFPLTEIAQISFQETKSAPNTVKTDEIKLLDIVISGLSAIAGIIVAVFAGLGIRQLRMMKQNQGLDFVLRTREQWISIADKMLEYPELVLTYANKNALDKLQNEILLGKNRCERGMLLREYAFANRVFEILAVDFYLGKEASFNELDKKLYSGKGAEVTSKRLIEIWNKWGLKEDYSDEFVRYADNVMIIKNSPNSNAQKGNESSS